MQSGKYEHDQAVRKELPVEWFEFAEEQSPK
jgi:hypothetical protein